MLWGTGNLEKWRRTKHEKNALLLSWKKSNFDRECERNTNNEELQ